MARLRKAWRARPAWSDDSDAVYAETASKARYRAWIDWRDAFDDLTLTQIQVRRAAELDMTLPDEHRLVADLTPMQRRLIVHAYGTESRQPGYRDHYCTAPGNLDALHLSWEFGLLNGPHGESAYGETPGWSGAFFYLTDLGKQVALSMVPTYP